VYHYRHTHYSCTDNKATYILLPLCSHGAGCFVIQCSPAAAKCNSVTLELICCIGGWVETMACPFNCKSSLLLAALFVWAAAARGAPPPLRNVEIFDPSVFNAAFYSATNPDIDHSSVESVQQHWQNYGVAEGRQAHGCFHTRQYLSRYEDIRAACKGDTGCALDHYLLHGISEGRVGYVEDGMPFGRATIADAALGICVSAGARTAGAVDSVVFQNTEMINTHDHGRQLQVAVTICTDSTAESCRGECYNPTEGGASSDDRFNPTSVLLNASTPANAVLSTNVLPAFWLHPGEHEPSPSAGCSVAINTANVSNYIIAKSVSFRPFSVPNAILFAFGLYLDDSVHMLQACTLNNASSACCCR
jgi:hypothetical protein